jgi:membrane fusion protein (multidrug efflux system)
VLILGVVLFWYFRFVAPYESTDDAFIDGFVSQVSPRVPGQVLRLRIRDNQEVIKGDVLVELDPKDYQVRVSRAQADLATARAGLEEAQARVPVNEAQAEQAHAAVTAAEAEAARAQADLKRYESVEARAVSRSQLTLIQTQARSTGANVEVARNIAKAADAQTALSRVSVSAAEARMLQAETALEQARLDLSYTKIQAPVTGRVTGRTVEPGVYVQTGQSLLALVPDELWVVANFKESQLAEMRPGQRVRIRVDAFPGRELHGKVDSIQAGTGARFSLLPPENAVGNYVKVVQRLPVKIVFDHPVRPGLEISPGMSVVPEVRVR